MRRLIAASAAACLLALFAAAPATARKANRAPRTGGWIVCNDTGTIHITPGLTLLPRPARFDFTLALFDCVSSDKTIHGGTVTATASSPAFSCAGGQIVDGTATFRWDNGRSSRLAWSGAGGGIALATGTIVGGSEFVGQPFAAYVAPANPDPSPFASCLDPPGLTALDIIGTDAIGTPPEAK